MEPIAAWPPELLALIRTLDGEPTTVQRLGGMSLNQVYRVRCRTVSLIVKRCPQRTEATFYQLVASRLRQVGVPIPALLGLVATHVAAPLPPPHATPLTTTEAHWLLLEDIPDPQPALNRGPPDIRMVVSLMRLHSATRGVSFDVPEPPLEGWTNRVTALVLGCFPNAVAVELAPLLRKLQTQSQSLAEPWCWISGDPNPLNWGERADGSLVLYDWERFQRGQPAKDLAITIAGLGDHAKYADLAKRYVAAWAVSPLSWPGQQRNWRRISA